jgi:hypothetical protein
MKRLILTTSDSSAGCLRQSGIADAVLPLGERFFLREPLPSDIEIAESLAQDDWLGRIYRRYVGEADTRTGVTDLCAPFDTVDVWIDPDPNAQLILAWLLEYLRPHEAIVSKLHLVQADFPIGELSPEDLAARQMPAVKIVDRHLELARSAWRAYRAPTPKDWFGLLSMDLSALPLFRPAAVARAA